MSRQYPLHIHISTLFIILILLVGSLIGWLGFSTASSILRTSTEEVHARISRETQTAFTDMMAPAELATRLLSHSSIASAASLNERLAALKLMREVLKDSAALTGIYAGYGDGEFFLLRRLHDAADLAFFKAPEGSAYLVQSIERAGESAIGKHLFFDSELRPMGTHDEPEYAKGYDPRTRDWYQAARQAGSQIKTAPYVFYSSHKVGMTIANRSARDESVVIGADIRLETLDHLLAGQKPTPGTQIVLASRDGLAVAFPGSTRKPVTEAGSTPGLTPIAELSPLFAAIAPSLQQISAEQPVHRSQTLDGETWHIATLPIRLEGAEPLYLIAGVPDSELMGSANRLLKQALLAIAAVILLAFPIAWWLARAIAGPMRELASEAEQIRHFEFEKPIATRSLIKEINELAMTMDGMKRAIRRFLEINQAVAGENNFDRLLPRLLNEALSAAEAEAGVLYLADADRLTPAAALNVNGSPLAHEIPPLPLGSAGPLLAGALGEGKAHSAPLSEADLAAHGLAATVSTLGFREAIAVPLLNRRGGLVGALLLIGRQPCDKAHLSFVAALSGSVAVTLENKELIHAQKALFEALIQLIAGAIDAKSPYTGGHCARVPELTKMLARAACAADSGPFRDFRLDDDAWEAVHVAAWLHDCGKLTTPEYVVDKATKLETIYDRIHEIRMRFEVIKRDAEIACLKSIAGGMPETEARAGLASAWQALDADFAFVAECNVGGEFMAPEKRERLAGIAARTWQRTLDDRIGIAHEEKERKARNPAAPLPATEPLLADRPEHLFERRTQDRIDPDNPWGIRMEVPELLYNKGELYNLSVARGTLANEERYKINEHMVQTLIMLSQLPFPKHLREVPEIACCHHEKMDGTGYPRRLVREQMGPVGRMMAIADIFEALTAVDRPYKKGKTLTESLRIMARMRDDAHIDPELFDLFLESGVWREYAGKFLRPEQIDAVDPKAFARAA